MSNYRVRQVLALGPMPDRQFRLLVALATWMTDESRTVKVGVDTLTTGAHQARNTFRKARRELEGDGRISTVPGGHGPTSVTAWTVHCLPAKGVNEVDRVNEDDVSTSAVRGSNGPKRGGQGQRADLHKPEWGLNRRANPHPPQPQLPVVYGLVPNPEGEGDQDHGPGPGEITALATEIRAGHPEWAPRTIRRALDTARAGRPWPLVAEAARACYADPVTESPGRLAQDGPWWHQAATRLRGTPATRPDERRQPCTTCHDMRRVQDADGRDVGPCPDCHPLSRRPRAAGSGQDPRPGAGAAAGLRLAQSVIRRAL